MGFFFFNFIFQYPTGCVVEPFFYELITVTSSKTDFENVNDPIIYANISRFFGYCLKTSLVVFPILVSLKEFKKAFLFHCRSNSVVLIFNDCYTFCLVPFPLN